MFSSDYLRFYVEDMLPRHSFGAFDNWDVGTIEIRPGALRPFDGNRSNALGIQCYLMDQPNEGLWIKLNEIPDFADTHAFHVDTIGGDGELNHAYITFLGEGVIELRLEGRALDSEHVYTADRSQWGRPKAPQEVRYIGVQDEDEVIPENVYDSEEWDMDAEDGSEDDSEDGSEDD